MKKKASTTEDQKHEQPEMPGASAGEFVFIDDDPKDPPIELGYGTISALAVAIAKHVARELRQMLPLHARLCAADTLHTAEKPATVFRHACNEADVAQVEINKHLQAATVSV